MNLTMAALKDVIRRTITKDDKTKPCFQVYHSAATANVTGDGTLYTITYETEVFDNGSDFASNTFTAYETGKYLLCLTMGLAGLTSAMTYAQSQLITSNQTYQSNGDAWVEAVNTGIYRKTMSMVVDMDAGDTCYCTAFVYGGTKVVDMQGTRLSNSFSGVQVA